MSPPSAAPAERLLCDTSFVGASAKWAARPTEFDWPADVLARIDRGILAISVITLAEARFGFLNAGWGESRILREENRLAGFLQVPLDMQIVNEWARLKDLNRRHGWNIGDNDLWIAATAGVRRYALVTCDQDQARIEDPSLDVIYLPV